MYPQRRHVAQHQIGADSAEVGLSAQLLSGTVEGGRYGDRQHRPLGQVLADLVQVAAGRLRVAAEHLGQYGDVHGLHVGQGVHDPYPLADPRAGSGEMLA